MLRQPVSRRSDGFQASTIPQARSTESEAPHGLSLGKRHAARVATPQRTPDSSVVCQIAFTAVSARVLFH
jgi:hypothetical protein